jgi:uncharacterized hydantoinase/oxoprolinase family protein
VEAMAADEKQEDYEQLAEKPEDDKVSLVVTADTQNSSGLRQEAYENVFNDVKAFVENLNMIIQNKNYNRWREALSEERLREISSPMFLATASNSASMRRRGIVLKTLNDYFLYVVVPSRANSQVDKIEIVDNKRVKVIYMHTRKVEGSEDKTETVPLLVYELIKDGNTWKIIR